MRTPAAALLAALAALAAGCSDGVRRAGDYDATVDVEPPGDATECSLPQVLCNGRCVNPAADRDHCGGCGVRCAAGQVCAGGRCDTACPEGQARCGDRCAVLATDRAHCGMCGNACPTGQVCSAGRCGLACAPSYLACAAPSVDAGVRADAGDGGGLASPAGPYCTDPRTDEFNCGACGVLCPPGNLCVGGACTVSCVRGQTQCGSTCADLQTSARHCGACNNACAGAQRCAAGRCEGSPCPTGQTLCGDVCANLRASAEHCGMCGRRCGEQSTCEAAACVPNCRRGYTACGDVCADLQVDLRHCGRCGSACPVGQSCVGGACALVCPFDRAPCGGACVDPSTDVRNCGGCGVACAAGAVCSGGACAQTCAPTQSRCPGGACADLRVDARNCGACGLACAAGEACVSGMCVPVAGADASACPSPSVRCGADCVDPRRDNRHCGGCGRACDASRLCLDGMCVAPCPLGQLRCAGTCINGLSDASNCGACGNACPSGTACVAGRCAPGLLPTRFTAATGTSDVTFLDACAAPGAARYLPASDNGEATLRMPFAFRYWTVDIPELAPVTVSANGWLGLDGMPFGGSTVSTPSTAAPALVVAVHAGDLETTAPVCVALLGAAPSRRWVVEWSGAVERISTGPVAGTGLVFEAVFNEDGNTIDYYFQSVTGTASSRYHGLEGPTGLSTGSVSGCPSTTTSHLCTVMTGHRVRFSPAP
ncbi:MAG: MXAN_6577-like cysteine-rich protein [Polyangiales bacterium]